MGRKVAWTDPAAEDVVETVEYIAKDSPSFAATLAQRICDAGDSLEDFSERGRPYADPAYPGFRELLVGPYRLVYEVEDERVVIHGVFMAVVRWSVSSEGVPSREVRGACMSIKAMNQTKRGGGRPRRPGFVESRFAGYRRCSVDQRKGPYPLNRRLG